MGTLISSAHLNSYSVCQPKGQHQWKVQRETPFYNLVKSSLNPVQQGQLYHIKSVSDIERALTVSQFRHDFHQHIVGIWSVHQNERTSVCSDSYQFNLVVEHIPFRLPDLGMIEFCKMLQYIEHCLKAAKMIKQHLGILAVFDQNMVGLNADGKCKLWINQNFSQLKPQYQVQKASQREPEEYVVHNIFEIFESSVLNSKVFQQYAQIRSGVQLNSFQNAVNFIKSIERYFLVNSKQNKKSKDILMPLQKDEVFNEFNFFSRESFNFEHQNFKTTKKSLSRNKSAKVRVKTHEKSSKTVTTQDQTERSTISNHITSKSNQKVPVLQLNIQNSNPKQKNSSKQLHITNTLKKQALLKDKSKNFNFGSVYPNLYNTQSVRYFSESNTEQTFQKQNIISNKNQSQLQIIALSTRNASNADELNFILATPDKALETNNINGQNQNQRNFDNIRQNFISTEKIQKVKSNKLDNSRQNSKTSKGSAKFSMKMSMKEMMQKSIKTDLAKRESSLNTPVKKYEPDQNQRKASNVSEFRGYISSQSQDYKKKEQNQQKTLQTPQSCQTHTKTLSSAKSQKVFKTIENRIEKKSNYYQPKYNKFDIQTQYSTYSIQGSQGYGSSVKPKFIKKSRKQLQQKPYFSYLNQQQPIK